MPDEQMNDDDVLKWLPDKFHPFYAHVCDNAPAHQEAAESVCLCRALAAERKARSQQCAVIIAFNERVAALSQQWPRTQAASPEQMLRALADWFDDFDTLWEGGSDLTWLLDHQKEALAAAEAEVARLRSTGIEFLQAFVTSPWIPKVAKETMWHRVEAFDAVLGLDAPLEEKPCLTNR